VKTIYVDNMYFIKSNNNGENIKTRNEKINRNLMLIKRLVLSLFALPIFVISSCSSDEKQTVALLN
jgi:hypothetical protein